MTPTLRAAIWMIGAITAFTLMAVAGRAAALNLDTFEIMFYRSCVGFAIVMACAVGFGTLDQVRADRLGLHFIRNVAHFTGQNLWFYAITVIPLAQVFALEFTGPIWVILLSPLFLKERIRPLGIAAAIIGFIGILLVAKPGATTISPGLIAAALCAIGFGLTAIFTRLLTKTQTITCILFYLTGMQAIFGLICAGLDGDMVSDQGAVHRARNSCDAVGFSALADHRSGGNHPICRTRRYLGHCGWYAHFRGELRQYPFWTCKKPQIGLYFCDAGSAKMR